jgi:hypothetical protein
MSLLAASAARWEIENLVFRLSDNVAMLRIMDAEVSRILRMPPGSWPLWSGRAMRWRPDEWQEVRLRQLLSLCELVRSILPDEGGQWLRTANPVMYGRAPIAVLQQDACALRAMLARLRREAADV